MMTLVMATVTWIQGMVGGTEEKEGQQSELQHKMERLYMIPQVRFLVWIEAVTLPSRMK